MIQEHQVPELLRVAADDVAVAPAPGRELAAAGARRRRRRRTAVAGVTAAVVVVASAGAWLATPFQEPDAGGTASAPTGTCVDPVPSRVLPSWARTGFSDPTPSIPYVLGDHGDIVAILFAQPLFAAPASDGRQNKILWASPYADGSPLRITASLDDGSAPVSREVAGGPGPSTIDLPRPGCWHLTLEWAGRTDTLALTYAAR
jgi:hypothetical protein